MATQRHLKNEKISIVMFVFLFLLYAVVYMTKNMFTSAMAVIVEEGFMTKSQTGLINAVFWLVYAPFQIVGGFAADRYSPYKLIMIGLGGAVLSNVIIYCNQNYYVMMAAWVFNAIVQFGIWPGVFKIVSTHISPDIRGGCVFWLLFSTSLGLGMSMLTASFVTHWQQNFLVSIVSLLAVIVIYTVLNPVMEKNMVEIKTDEEINKEKFKIDKEPILPLVFSSGLIFFMVVCLFRVATENGMKMMTPVMLMESYDELPGSISTRISSILIIFSALGIFIAGFVKKKITKNEPKAQIILYAVSLLPMGVVGFVGYIHYVWILVALSASVMLIHSAAPFSQSFIALRFGKYDRAGTVSGVINATASAGNILASYIFARMSEFMPWQGVAISWFVIVAICCLLCVVVLPRWTKFIRE